MPTFDTPGPIQATIEFGSGEVRVNAGDRQETLVEVRPSEPDRAADQELAQQTEISYADGKLLVRSPRAASRRWSPKKPPSVVLTVQLPAESELAADAYYGAIRVAGSLGDTRVHTSHGDISLDETATVRASSEHGDISVNRPIGPVDIATNGSVRIGDAGSTITITAGNGDIVIDRARTDIKATASHGSIRVGRLAAGNAVLEAGYGSVSVGIPRTTTADVDVNSAHGQVRDTLDTGRAPVHTDAKADIYARTTYGDIDVHWA
ncbi:DUF4097 family beta strand repeat-containing protein [Nonomuraea typhae]|uniref:DUF4097 family beta strand repeat-containing protein n=1 Tax=Nonomuraea typhae TaxID=2603600 RepID=A0ABW7YZD1_9ACTN